jgi:adenylate cyclase class 2
MKPEIEAKFLNVNHDELRPKLRSAGAACKASVRLMRRQNFDFPDLRLGKMHGWARVRDEGDKVTLAYKQLNSRELDGTHEVSVTVDSFDNTCSFLESIGLEGKAFQETKRESWQLDNVEIELDEWPWIKSFVELEGPDEQSLKDVANKLGLDWADAVHGSVEIVYATEYDVTDQEVDSWESITFGPVPDWLEAKRRV